MKKIRQASCCLKENVSCRVPSPPVAAGRHPSAGNPGRTQPGGNQPGKLRAGTVRNGHAPGKHGVFTAFGLAAEAEPLGRRVLCGATPIGNLKDVSLRALGILAGADAVLAEDTRITRRLLAHYGITTPLLAYHEHSADAVRERMIARLREGQALALVSGCGDAAGFPIPATSWFQGGDRRETVRDADSRPLRRAHRTGGFRAAERSLLLRGFPAVENPGPGAAASEFLPVFPALLMLFESPAGACRHAADAAAVLGPRPAWWPGN